ncbi:hypothetical protein AABM38_10105 [Heyndrickxia sp. MSNUG]|uniref:hypothetical protein n=1 Tax=Heyndrickxia sp. MSNUG TaxID=3136677 RepID=UPI003C2E4F65
MSRKNAKDTRFDGMSQREQRKLERIKKKKNPRKDNLDWTTRLFAKLNQAEDEANEQSND